MTSSGHITALGENPRSRGQVLGRQNPLQVKDRTEDLSLQLYMTSLKSTRNQLQALDQHLPRLQDQIPLGGLAICHLYHQFQV